MSVVLSVISLSLCISGFFFIRWYIERKTAASNLLADYRTEVYRLIAEIDAATDRDSLLVEERIKMLKQILDDTDRRISVYMRELQHSRDSQAMYASLGRGIRAALDSRPVPNEPNPMDQTDPAVPVAAPVSKDTTENASQPATKPPAARKRSPKKRQTANENNQDTQTTAKKPKIKVQIAELSAQGLSTGEIASHLGISIAEVDLALNLLHRST